MNIAMIMSGGVGRRFGSVIPKQYNLIHGRPVIDYVIEACEESKLTDRIVVVCDLQCVKYSKLLSSGKYDIAPNGEERYDSINNGFEFIKRNYSCDNICILDAVAPFVYGELLDDYFTKLNDFDAVITCQKITGSLGNYDFDVLNREDFYITQSPEAFRFPLITEHFNPNFESTELAWQLPRNTKKYLNFEFKNNLKLTYDFDLKYAEYMIDYFRQNQTHNAKIIEKENFVTKGLSSFLLRTENEKTNLWLDEVCNNFSRLTKKWKISNFTVNQSANYGIVIFADSETYGKCVLKLIPPFIERYENEKKCYQSLSDRFMCKMLDYDDEASAVLLKCANPAKYAKFEDNIALTSFFDSVFSNLLPCDNGLLYTDELKKKLNCADKMPYGKSDILPRLEKAFDMYNQSFSNEKTFLLHGDLHEYNILKDADKYIAVDPIGVTAPKEFEATRFIRNDILSNPEFDMRSRFMMLRSYFGRWVDERLLTKAMFIDLTATTYNASFEYEDKDVFYRNIKLIEILEEILDL